MRWYLTPVALGLAFLLATGAGAAQNKGEKPALDRDFLVKAVTCNHAEVQYSELADKHASSAHVKDFARKMQKAHTRSNESLGRLAADQKLAVAAGTEKETKDTAERLSRLKGADFDREYMKTMVDAHERAVRLFDTQARDGKDARLSTFARDQLPRLREHLKEARAIYDEVKTK
jgi:putative membrane protein